MSDRRVTKHWVRDTTEGEIDTCMNAYGRTFRIMLLQLDEVDDDDAHQQVDDAQAHHQDAYPVLEHHHLMERQQVITEPATHDQIRSDHRVA